ncbi:MAG: amidohydrolase [Bacillota bacterium]|nr:amidohydrolase [Bacillota bacterium]
MSSESDKVLGWIDESRGELARLSDEIWRLAEVGLKEFMSAKLQEEFLAGQGFAVTSGVAGMPTAFVASWGCGRPVLAFLGEYDALPRLSQDAVPERRPLVAGAPGHGCGHNLLGMAAVAAAAALKAGLEAAGLSGTVRYYGCPAEETAGGKVYMVKHGLFEDVDAALTWHPGALNAVGMKSCLATNNVKFVFHGRTAHAAGDPHHGRSALDGVELMNVGANYLREHIIEKARLHYVITDGGGEPNVVPARAEVWYYLRAPEREQVEEIYAWLLDIAEGAALMTGTRVEVDLLGGLHNIMPNKTLAALAHAKMVEVGPNAYDEAELEFGRRIQAGLPAGQREAGLRAMRMPAEMFAQVIHAGVMPFSEDETPFPASTDVGDVSWVCPTVSMGAATGPLGQPGHSWQVVAAAGSGIGHKGMLLAAKVMALTGLELALRPEVVAAAKEEWAKRREGRPYRSPLPEGVDSPKEQL